MLDQVINTYNAAIYDTDREQALDVIHSAVEQGIGPEDIIFKVVVPALDQMIKSISEDFDANLAQNFIASQIAQEVTEEMVAKFPTKPESIGLMIIGTACGDMHSLGKKIVSGCLKALMVDTIDLGVNVPAEKLVDAAVANNAQIIGVSAMMIHTAMGDDGSLKVRKLLKEKGLEEQIRIIVGGAPYRYDSELYKAAGADAWAEDGVTAGRVITALIKEVQS